MKTIVYGVCVATLALALAPTGRPVEASKILSIFPTMSKSHWILGSALMKELALDGHDVTVISPFRLSNPPKNYRHVEIVYNSRMFEEIMDEVFDKIDDSIVQKMMELGNFVDVIANTTLTSPEVQTLLHSDEESFDLLVLEIFLDDVFLGFADHFNCPVVGMSTFGASSWVNSLTGSPQPLSYVPHPMSGLTDKMNFWQRLGNVLFTGFDETLLMVMCDPIQQRYYEKFFPNANRSLAEMRRHGVSLVLVNSHFSLSFPRPYLPNLIEVGGFHVNRKVNPLPEDIKSFIEQSKHGVIYFSMGSNLKPSKMDRQKRDDIVRVLSGVKQNIIWKWDDDTLVLDKGKFLLGKWFPQDDILAHPNVKLFITHGGLLSCTESIYHGVPIVGIPIFGDQLLNMARAEQSGWGIGVAYTQLTEATFGKAVHEVVSNEIFATNVKTISRRLRDQPLAPMDTAKFWVEYVLRHDGAKHLISAAQDLNFVEYNNLDVYAFIVMVGFVVLMGLRFAIKKLGVKKACEMLNTRLQPIKDELKNATWETITQACYLRNMDLTAQYHYKNADLKPYTIWGVSCAEIETDLLTGNVQLRRVDILEDTGESLSPGIDVGQIEGAFVMGTGYWLTESLVYDMSNGALLTNRTWNYKPPGAKDIPVDFRIKLTQIGDSQAGVLRSKATGEPALTMSVVVLFALRQALRSAQKDAGMPDDWIPLGSATTPEQIFLKASNTIDQFKLN